MTKGSGIIDWAAVSKVANLDEVIRFLPPEHVIDVLGAERALQLGLARVRASEGGRKSLEEALSQLSAVELQEMFQRLLQAKSPGPQGE